MEPVLSDADLLAASVMDPPAFAVLYERHGLRVRRYAVGRVGSEAGEDVSAEVFMRAFRTRDRYRPERDTALPWLLGIASHVIAHHRRAEMQRLKTLQRLASTAPELIEHEDRQLGADLVTQLLRLRRADRDALLLIAWGELSYDEAASALAVPVGTVKSRVARARRTLSGALEHPTRGALEMHATPRTTTPCLPLPERPRTP